MSRHDELGFRRRSVSTGLSCLFLLEKYPHESAKDPSKINQWAPTAPVCQCCGFRCPGKMSLKLREWTCDNCGGLHDRDINAAKMVKHYGILELRAGGVHVPAVEACVRRATCPL